MAGFEQRAKSRREALLALITGAAAEPAAGIAGLYGVVTGGLDKGVKNIERTRQALTYQPRDPSALQALGRAVEPVTSRLEALRTGMGDQVHDRTGSPAAATAAYMVPDTLLTLIGARGAGVKGPTLKQIAERSAAPTGPARQLGIFAGPKAATADHAAMNRATQRLAAGDDPKVVWAEEGWMRGPDGKMRFEIDDSQAKAVEYPNNAREALDQEYYGSQWSPERHHPAYLEAARRFQDTDTETLLSQWSEQGDRIVDRGLSGDMDGAKALLDERLPLDHALETRRRREHGPLSAYINHPELSAAYPDAASVMTYVRPWELGDSLGRYQREIPGRLESLTLAEHPNSWAADRLSVPLHEVQHIVQRREGFAVGGSPSKFAAEKDMANAQINAINTRMSEVSRAIDEIPQWDQARSWERAALKKEYDDLMEKKLREYLPVAQLDPFERYHRLAGEAEARAVQKRLDYTPEQRRAIYPLDDYDVPVDELIIRSDK